MSSFRRRVIGTLTGKRAPAQAPPQGGVPIEAQRATSAVASDSTLNPQSSALSEKQRYLSEMEIFCDLSREDMDHIARTTTMITTEKGKVFYYPEDAGEVVFLLKRGKVQLYRLSPEGRKLVIATLSAGAVFGEMSLIGQGMYNTFAEAVEDCLICVMSRSDMVRILSEKPQVALRILEIMGRRLQHVEDQLEEIAFRPVPVRLALLLLRLAGGIEQQVASAESSQITGLTHQELADMIGTYRETVSATLNDFKARGLVDLAPKCITLLDVEGLRAICES